MPIGVSIKYICLDIGYGDDGAQKNELFDLDQMIREINWRGLFTNQKSGLSFCT
jgi:hypothetical protein